MSLTFALVPSPLLGPVAWEPVRDALWARQHEAFAVAVPAHPMSGDQVLEAIVAAIPVSDDVVLVPHSNAGLYAPAVAAAVRAAATVFVDAGLPSEAGPTPLAPPQFYDFLAALADADGQLPPWTQWWDSSDLDGLFPSAEWRSRIEQSEPRLPLAYFRSTVEVADGWAARPCAYLAFGDTYADEIGRARRNDWPVVVLDGGHLHALHQPDRVADEIVGLAARLGVVARER